MSIISVGRPINKQESEEIRRWLKESEAAKLKKQQERDQARREVELSESSAAS